MTQMFVFANLFRIKVGSLAASAAVVLLLATSGEASASEALAKKYACAACHQADKKVVGPAWREISSKYSDGKVSADQLAASIKKGSSGKWGPMAMPPQAQVPEADLKALAVWILEGAK
ncbi:c-type cytochrome [Roseateles sp. So40a]|uniref:c-type cytochrome n=1 Tax=Roseateles sp. So40a TaxID=3400226 RepID=UPI003A8B1218